jgi:transposase InsO family protein
MNSHKNARLTLVQREELVRRIDGVGVVRAAAEFRVSRQTAAKWKARHTARPEALLGDWSSRPHRTRSILTPEQRERLVALRLERKTLREVASGVGCTPSTAQRALVAFGLNRLPPMQPKPEIVRYEHQAPGDLLHLDIKKLGRIIKPGHRVTGDPRDNTDGAGWEAIHIAIDDHSRVSFAQAYPDETQASTVAFLKAAVAFYASLGIRIARLLTDNGAAYRSKVFAATCADLGLKHKFTRPYTPRTNGKAERFIQTALREWAYAAVYATSERRIDALPPWLHHYNVHRPHSALGYKPPISRLPVNNVSIIDS